MLAWESFSESESLTNSVSPSSETPEGRESRAGQVRNRLERASPDPKRPRIRIGDSLRACGKEAVPTNHRGDVHASSDSAKKDGGNRQEEDLKLSPVTSSAGRTNQSGNPDASFVEKDDAREEEEDTKPSLVTGNVRTGSDPEQEAVQEEAATDGIPAGWTRMKLEPDWQLSTPRASRRKSRAAFGAQPLGRRRTNEAARTRNASTRAALKDA
jgi:hypothetical protein